MKQIWDNIIGFCKKIARHSQAVQDLPAQPVSCFAQRTVSEAAPSILVTQGLAGYAAPQGSSVASTHQLNRRQTRSERHESIDKLKQQLLVCTDPQDPTTQQLIVALLKKNAIESLCELINTKADAQSWCLVAIDVLMQQPFPSYALALRLCKQHLALPVYLRLAQHALTSPDAFNEIEKISENVFHYYRIYHSTHLAACSSHKQWVYVAAALVCAQNRAWQDAYQYAQKCPKHPQVWKSLLESILEGPNPEHSFENPTSHHPPKEHWARIFWGHMDPVERRPWEVVEKTLQPTPKVAPSVAAVCY